MALASVKDVEVRFYRELAEDEKALVEARLGDAERKIRIRIPDLDNRIQKNPALAEIARTVCADAVIRLVRNPEGYVQETDGNYTYMLSQSYAEGRLTILPEEWLDLGIRNKARILHVTPQLPWETE